MKFTYTRNTISIKDKVLTDLDEFVFDFLHVLDKYCTYVIISGYLPIFFGRSRGTGVVDVFIDHIDEQTFIRFYNELVKENYYFLNSLFANRKNFSLLPAQYLRMVDAGRTVRNKRLNQKRI